MPEETISREEEAHIERLEDEVDKIEEEEEIVYDACCCKNRLVEELETLERVRSVVLPGAMIYDAGDIRKFMTLLSMYPAFATVSEVVEDIAAYYEESER